MNGIEAQLEDAMPIYAACVVAQRREQINIARGLHAARLRALRETRGARIRRKPPAPAPHALERLREAARQSGVTIKEFAARIRVR